MEQAVYNTRVHPLAFGHARFEMTCHMLNVSFPGRMQGGAEATGPVFALAQEFDDLLGVRAGGAAVALLVVLIERVASPEAPIAAGFGARVLPPALVEFVLVALPVILALEACLARRTPVDVLLVDGSAHGRSAEKRRTCRRGHLWWKRERSLHA